MKRTTKPKTYEAEVDGRKVRVTIPDDFDSCEERQKLAHALAAWKTAGWVASGKATWWHRRVRRLARACAMPLSKVMADLERDAEAILAEEENESHVAPEDACPACGEGRTDCLVWDEGGTHVQCQTCSHTYKPGK